MSSEPRIVREDDVRAAFEAAVDEAKRRNMKGYHRERLAMNRISEVFERATLADSREAVPALVGTMEAAELLGVAKTRISRFRERGRMPDPIVELAAGPVFLRSEVSRFAGELEAERRSREKGREAVRA